SYQVSFPIVNAEPTTAQDMFETLRGIALQVNGAGGYTASVLPGYPCYADFEQNVEEELPSLRLVAIDTDAEPFHLTASSATVGHAFDPPLTANTGDFGAISSSQELGENIIY